MPSSSIFQESELPSFGEKLRLEREKRKMTLEQISSSTKIGTRMLQALEEEKFSQLPGGIFNKGFVRAYARTLGLDEDQTVADYLEASGDAPQPVRFDHASRETAHATPLRITDESSDRLEIRAEVASRQLPWGVFAVILLIIALALSLWNHRRREHEKIAHPPKTSQHLPTPASEQNAPAGSSSAAGSTSTASPTNSSPSTASPNGASPSNASPGNAAPSNAAPSKASPSNTSPSTALPNNQPVSSSVVPAATVEKTTPDKSPSSSSANSIAAPGEFVISIVSRDTCWLSVIVDGKPIGSEILEAGDKRTFRGHKDVIAKIGNAAALDFQLNGSPLPVGGENGEVKTVTIGPSGIIPAAPNPTAATPTTNP